MLEDDLGERFVELLGVVDPLLLMLPLEEFISESLLSLMSLLVVLFAYMLSGRLGAGGGK